MDVQQEKRKRLLSPIRHRKSKVCVELCCPVCEVTLWPGSVKQHYLQEEVKLARTSLTSHRKHSQHGAASKDRWKDTKDKTLLQNAQQVLESVRRRQLIFAHHHHSAGQVSCDDAVGTSGNPAHSSYDWSLTADQEENAGVEEEEEDGGGSEVYEEYTWCNVTRVRATSLLTPEARANMFDGTVVCKDETNNESIDVEQDETETYGPIQYDEKGSRLAGDESKVVVRDDNLGNQPYQCLICMDSYRSPVVSIQCWHVYCEDCWTQALGTKKMCPTCKQITSHSDLRKLYL